MKTVKLHIIFSWVLLLCFIGGQYMVYAHQHQTKAHSIVVVKKPFQHAFKERCDLCDAMHHTVMLPAQQVQLPALFSSNYQHFVPQEHRFVPIGLILAGGRSPPAIKYIS